MGFSKYSESVHIQITKPLVLQIPKHNPDNHQWWYRLENFIFHNKQFMPHSMNDPCTSLSRQKICVAIESLKLSKCLYPQFFRGFLTSIFLLFCFLTSYFKYISLRKLNCEASKVKLYVESKETNFCPWFLAVPKNKFYKPSIFQVHLYRFN